MSAKRYSRPDILCNLWHKRVLTVYRSTLRADLDRVRSQGLDGVLCRWQELDLLQGERLSAVQVITKPDADLSALSTFTDLECLSLGRIDHIPVDLTELDKLTHLSLPWHKKTKFPACFPVLEELSLRKYSPETKNLFGLHAPSLRVLTLTQGNLGSLSGLERSRELSQLKLLYLHRLADLGALAENKQLVELQLDHCKRIGDLSALSGCSGLRKLIVDSCGTLPSLAFIKALPKLDWFVFMDTDVEDGDLAPLLGRKFEYLYFTKMKHFSHTVEQVIESSSW